MNVTVADPAERGYKSPAHFFSHLISFWVHTSLCICICYKQKQPREFHLVMFHMQSTYLLKLTVRLRLPYSLFLFAHWVFA